MNNLLLLLVLAIFSQANAHAQTCGDAEKLASVQSIVLKEITVGTYEEKATLENEAAKKGQNYNDGVLRVGAKPTDFPPAVLSQIVSAVIANFNSPAFLAHVSTSNKIETDEQDMAFPTMMIGRAGPNLSELDKSTTNAQLSLNAISPNGDPIKLQDLFDHNSIAEFTMKHPTSSFPSSEGRGVGKMCGLSLKFIFKC